MSAHGYINGIILAGGKSSRMGQPKGLLHWNGKPFIECCREALAPLVADTVLVGDRMEYDHLKIKRIEDQFKDAGPLAGLHAGLKWTDAPYNLVLSCDMPLVNHLLLGRLLDKMTTALDVVCFEVDNRKIPLAGLYSSACATLFEAELRSGERKLLKALDKLRVKTIVPGTKIEGLLKNVNTVEQYKELNYEHNR